MDRLKNKIASIATIVLFLVTILPQLQHASTQFPVAGIVPETVDSEVRHEMIIAEDLQMVYDYCNLWQVPEYVKQAVYNTMSGCGILHEIAYIVDKESDWDIYARNPESTAKGLMQFLDTTWMENCYGDVFDATANLSCGARLIERGQAYYTWYKWWQN